MSRQQPGPNRGSNGANTEYQLYNRQDEGESGSFPVSIESLSSLHQEKDLGNFAKVFKENPKNLCKFLQTDEKNGIQLEQQDYRETARFKKYGENRIRERPAKSFGTLVWEAFNDKTMLLLTAAAVVSFALGLYELWGQPPEYDPEGHKITKVDWIEGVAIMIAVVVVVLVGAVNDYQKELQFMKLNRKKEDRKIIVIRDGDEILISIFDLLVGDLINLQTGDVVPADCILVDGKCEADESSVTGESEAIKVAPLETVWKSYSGDQDEHDDEAPTCMLTSGSKLLSGLGKAVVTAVGENSIYGKTMMSLDGEPDPTPLQERLNELCDSISVYGCGAAMLLFVVLFIRFLVNIKHGGKYENLTPAQRGGKFMNIFITAVTIIVVAVPEGLPLAVTLALAFATTRMTKDGNLVRVLSACETMGSATAVCSDKTGTLTENVMTVVRGFLGDSHFNDERDDSDECSKKVFLDKCSSELRKDLLANIALNSTAFENKSYNEDHGNQDEQTSTENPFSSNLNKVKSKAKSIHLDGLLHPGGEDNDDDETPHANEEPFIGSKTETALLGLARKSLGMKSVRELRQDPSSTFDIEKIVQVIPFESSRKWGAIVVKYQGSDHYRVFIKGAAEIVFSRCQYQRTSDDKAELITKEMKGDITDEIQSLASGALRAISLAHRDFRCKSWPPADLRDEEDKNIASEEKLFGKAFNPGRRGESDDRLDDEEKGFILDSIVGIQDPLRDGVKFSVEQCQRAGVTVRMVTGDNVVTAKAIAKNCHILSDSEQENSTSAMEGPKFRQLSKKERLRIVPKLRVLARSSPEDKKLLVKTLREMGEVVAATGDGTNDAPALKLADVGFSMGISGTEVAREASDIILMTDDFSAIVNAIKWGRCVSVSIKKFIQFQLTVNITAVILTFVSSVSSMEEKSVLTAVQLLWVNLIMDTLAALALATDKPDPLIMDRKPTGRSTPLISVSTWKMILSQSTLQLIITFFLTFKGRDLLFPGKDKLTGHEQQQLNACTFNTFVWLQFFTLLVSRKLDEGDGISKWRERISKSNLDFFQDLFRNGYFIAIMALIGGCQILIMFFGGTAFSIAYQTPAMWAIAILAGMLSIPMGVLVRICPDEWVLKIFPSKLLRKIKYVITLEFLRSSEKRTYEDEESLLERDGTPSSGSTSEYY